MISFVIPAHNEERLLGATLDSIQASANALSVPFEIIVVDDASIDRTREIALARGAQVIPVNLRHIAAARNAGARAARGDRFVFVDADTLLTPSLLASAIQAMRDGAVGGGARVNWEGTMPMWARAMIVVAIGTMNARSLAAGCFMFCTRAAFDAVGGLDERLYAAEEIAFSQALKKQGRFVLLHEKIVTSGRKLRTHSARETFWMVARVMMRGRGGVRNRRHLAWWYGERRHEN